MRAFIGIKLEDKYKKKLENIRSFLIQSKVMGNFTNINNIHLTLCFIGEIKEENVSAIKEMISQIDISELNIEVSSIEVFKSYLILKVDKNDRLLGIQKKISDELIKQGFNIDRKEFFPHITIVREVKNVNEKDLDSLNKNTKMISEVSKIELFESKRVNGQLIYISL